MSDTLRTYSEATGGLLDFPSNVLSHMLSPADFDLELRSFESVCGGCNLTFNRALPTCPNC